MANTYRVIDRQGWERAMHCMVFRDCIEPAFCVIFEADITKYKQKIKQKGLSFTMAMVYAFVSAPIKLKHSVTVLWMADF